MKPNQLSQTAAFIAIKFYGLTQMQPYRSWFDDEVIQFYDRLVQFLPAPLGWYHSALKKSWIRKFFIFSEELLLPGDLMHILMRKYFIGEKVRELLQEDYKQLLIMGAGFDHLGYLHARDGFPCFEIDAPRMAALKHRFLDLLEWNHPQHHIIDNHFPNQHTDFSLKQVPNLDPKKETVIVAEGFFDYLTVKSAQKILEDLATFFKNKALLVSTVFALDELSALHRNVFTTSVRMVGERIRLGLSKERFDDLLRTTGFGNKLDTLPAGAMSEGLLLPNNIHRPDLNGFYLTFSKNDEKT